jgi:hypothetical protein
LSSVLADAHAGATRNAKAATAQDKILARRQAGRAEERRMEPSGLSDRSLSR